MVDSVFGIVIGGWIGQFELFKSNTTKDVFSLILQNSQNSSFSNIIHTFSKMYGYFFRNEKCMNIFLQKRLVNQMTSSKTFLWQTSNYFRIRFSWDLYLLKSEIQGYRAVALRGKKRQFRKDVFGIFEILEYTFFFEHFQNVSVLQFGSSL